MVLEQLLAYQKEDKKLMDMEREIVSADEYKKYNQAKKFIKAAPERISAYDRRAAELKSLVAELSARCEEISKDIDEYADLDEMIEGGGDISYYIRTVKALSDKLSSLKSRLSELTAEIKSVDDEYTKFRKQTIEMQKQGKENESKYKVLKANYERDSQEIKEKLVALSKDIRPEIMEKYLKKRKEGIFPIVVPLKDSSCICGMNFSISQITHLSGGNVIECEHCRRFIYRES